MRNKKLVFDLWVILGAMVGLGLAVGVYLFVRFVIFGNPVTTGDITQGDIISATATVLGGFGIGALAVMQYRKHLWEKNQAKLDEDTRTGERLGKAIEHLGDDDEHIRLGAVYEIKRLVEDSPRDRQSAILIIIQFIRKCNSTGDAVSPDVEAAARILSQWVRENIEGHSVIYEKVVFWLNRRIQRFKAEHDYYTRRDIYKDCSFNDACKAICALEIDNPFPWGGFRGFGSYLVQAELKKAELHVSDFAYAQLGGCILEGAYLRYANFKGAHLAHSNLNSANLEGANLVATILNGADLRNVILNNDTTFTYQSKNLRPLKWHISGSHWRRSKEGYTFFPLIDDDTLFSPGIRMKYFGEEEPDHSGDPRVKGDPNFDSETCED